MRRTVAALVVAVGAALGLVLNVGLFGTVAAGAATGTGAGTATAVAYAQEEEAPVGQDGQFEFTVWSVECGIEQIDLGFAVEYPAGQFCEAELTVENVGDSQQFYFANDQYIVDQDGRQHGAESVLSEPMSEQLNPGTVIDTTVVFDVPEDIEIDHLRLHDSVMSQGAEIPVDVW